MDTELVEKIVHEVKSQGVFDEFRKDSIADVDTKPAYQNLRQRVENTVKKFLSEQKWSIETNKNQLREKLRRHITESGFLDVGVERIVDQVVNPKICSVFQPRIEEIAYKYLGVPPPPKKFEPPPPPLMHPLPPLPLNAPPLKVETSSLLPTDLEQVSPDSDSATVRSDVKEDRFTADMDADEDESPPFEPLIKYETQETKGLKVEARKEAIAEEECEASQNGGQKLEESNNDHIKSENVGNNNDSIETSNFALESAEEDKEVSPSVDPRISQDSQLSSVSSDSRLSPNGKEDSLQSSSQENVTANISEEAQMPKFNENSCEPNVANGNASERDKVKSELHFDIKKDEIKFEGTERKTAMEVFASIVEKSEEKRFSHNENISPQENKRDSFNFDTEKLTEIKEDEGERTPNAQELSFGSSIDDSSSVPASHTPKNSNHKEEKVETPPSAQALKQTKRPTTPTAAPIQMHYLPWPVPPQKLENDFQKRYSSSSSSKHKKHSKERRKSYEREKETKERHRSGKEMKDSSKYHHSSGSKSKHKYSSSSTSSKYYSSHSKSKEKDVEKYSSSSAHSSSKHTKHSHSHSSSSPIENLDFKKSKRDSDRRHHSSSSSSSKRSDKKDDHHEAKQKIQRRKTTDSNDDDDDVSKGGGKSGYQYKSNSSSYSSKFSKSSYNEHKPSTYKTSDYQKDQGYKDSVENSAYNLPINNVVILNDLLENPQTQFIQLNNEGHLVEKPFQQKQESSTKTEGNEILTMEFNNNVELRSLEEKSVSYKDDVCLVEDQKEQAFSCEYNDIEEDTDGLMEESSFVENKEYSNDLLYFEEIQDNFVERLSLINATMDLCRSAVNSLRFDSLSDESPEFSNEEDIMAESNRIELLRQTLKRKSEYSYENYVTPRKRNANFMRNEFEECQTKSSPTPSDSSSVNSKENEEICKNTNRAKKSFLDQHKVNQKLSQQQRYSSEDLYKPRPILGQRSRRRGMNS